MKPTSAFALSFVASVVLFPFVAAHGFIQSMTIDGQNFEGSPVAGQQIPSGIRQVFTANPIKGAMNRDINCGPGAKPATDILDANPGSTLQFNWRGADGSKWPHNIGPMFTYLASCGDVTCDQFDPINAQWFKIQEVGKDENNVWGQNELFNGGVATVQMPPTLAPGNYMARHEIIALHLATAMGGAEFYAGCAQLRVGGNESGFPSPGDLVSLPGAYSDTDPGIFDPTVFDPQAPYVFPGPPVSSISATSPPSAPSPAPSLPPASSSTSNTGRCLLRNQQPALRPRRISRIMRDIRIH